MKIVLGTVQFGVDYGVISKSPVNSDEIKKILDLSKKNNITMLDTAYSYGNSEEKLGKILSPQEFNIITKTIKQQTPSEIEKAFKESLKRLNRESVYGLMFHDPAPLLGDNADLLWDKLLELKESGLVKKIGVSVYTAQEIDIILNRYAIGLIQLPINILDKRLIKSGHLKELKSRNIEIHARSVFLKGLLLKSPEELPDHFEKYKDKLNHFHQELKNNNITPVEACLNFVKKIEEIDYILCGVRSSDQLKEIINSYNKDFRINYSDFESEDNILLDPRLW